MNWRNEITADPAVCHGQACFNGPRVLVHIVLANMAAGISEAQILRDYPSLTMESLHAAIAYAAEIAQEALVALPE